MNIKTGIALLLLLIINMSLYAKEKIKIQDPNLIHVQKLHKEKKYQEVIDYLIKKIETQKTNQIYYHYISGAYSILKDDQNSFTYLMRGYLYNPTTLYARKQIHPGLNYLYKKFKNHDKYPWLKKYYEIKKLFNANKLPEAEKLALSLLKDKTNVDLTAILCKDIKTLLGNASAYDSTLRNIADTLGSNCPEYIHFELGELLYKSGKYKHAIQPLAKSVELNKQRRRSRALYGASLLYSGKYQEANVILDRTTKKFPDFSEARLFYALSFWALKKNSFAIMELNSILNKTTPLKIRTKAKSALTVMQAGELFLTPEMMREVVKYLPKGTDPLEQINKKIKELKKSDKQSEKKPVKK